MSTTELVEFHEGIILQLFKQPSGAHDLIGVSHDLRNSKCFPWPTAIMPSCIYSAMSSGFERAIPGLLLRAFITLSVTFSLPAQYRNWTQASSRQDSLFGNRY